MPMYMLNEEETSLYIETLRQRLEPRLSNKLPPTYINFMGCIRISINRKLDTITQISFYPYTPNMSRHLTLSEAPDFLKEMLFESSLEN